MKFPRLIFLFAPLAVSASSRYIIELKPEATFTQITSAAENQIETQNIVKTISIGENFKVLVADLEDNKIEALKLSSYISEITPDRIVYAFDNKEDSELHVLEDSSVANDVDTKPVNEEKDSFFEEVQSGKLNGYFNSEIDTDLKVQSDAPYHLARLSSKRPLYEGSPPYSYYYGSTGKDVYAYILDNGVYVEQEDFEGRAVVGRRLPGGIGIDIPHGTHVAGLVGSATFGVAKEVNIIDVQVFGALGSGPVSDILSGLQWAVQDREQKGNVKAVANLSLGGLYQQILNRAASAAVSTGLVVVVAAGNSFSNARRFSPASADGVLAVGAFDDKTDTLAVFSNYGELVQVYAPGVNISSWGATQGEIIQMSGTSMASPIVAGYAATLLEEDFSPKYIINEIVGSSIEGALNFGDGWMDRHAERHSHNRILYNNYGPEDNFEIKKSPFQPDKQWNKLIVSEEQLAEGDQ